MYEFMALDRTRSKTGDFNELSCSTYLFAQRNFYINRKLALWMSNHYQLVGFGALSHGENRLYFGGIFNHNHLY